nr:ferrous iron transporter B [Spirochaetota bacterium]
MDKFMQKIGLPGKSFVPMIVGFGCSVPAVMASRTLESRKDRIVTIFLIPLMSCGARLPVYALFAAVFFPENAALAVFSLYAVGIIFAVITGFLFKKAVYKNEVSHFVMELPVYNFPRPKHILIHTWNRLKVFILSAGKVIIIGSVILAVLNSAGHDFSFSKDRKEDSLLTFLGKKSSVVLKPLGITEDNWPATVAVFTGIFSKEAVIGTLNSLYSQMNETEEQTSIPEMIKSAFSSIPEYFSDKSDDQNSALFAAKAKFSNGNLSVYAYLLFILIYFPCIATLGAIAGEIGWKGAALSVSYLTLLAWAVSSLFYQLTAGHNIIFISISSSVIILIIAAFTAAGKFLSRRKSNADGKNQRLS